MASISPPRFETCNLPCAVKRALKDGRERVNADPLPEPVIKFDFRATAFSGLIRRAHSRLPQA
jgi:hypothetical protein